MMRQGQARATPARLLRARSGSSSSWGTLGQGEPPLASERAAGLAAAVPAVRSRRTTNGRQAGTPPFVDGRPECRHRPSDREIYEVVRVESRV